MKVDGANLCLRAPDLLAGILQSAGEDGFRGEEREFAFTRDAAGAISGFTLDASRAQNLRFEKR